MLRVPLTPIPLAHFQRQAGKVHAHIDFNLQMLPLKIYILYYYYYYYYKVYYIVIIIITKKKPYNCERVLPFATRSEVMVYINKIHKAQSCAYK